AAVYGELMNIPPDYLDEEPGNWRLPHDRTTLLFNLLLQHGFNPSVQDNRALSWASFHGHIEIVKLLLAYPGVTPTFTAIQYAINESHTLIVQLLLSKANNDVFDDAAFDDLVYDVVTANLVDITSLLLSFQSVTPPSRALSVACEKGYLEIVRLLLKDGRTDVSEVDFTSVFKPDCLDIVTLLLQDGRMTQGNLNACLFAASAQGWTDITKLVLLDDRADPNIFKSRPISFSITSGHLEVLEILWNDPRTVVTAKQMRDWIKVARKHTFGAIAKFLESKLNEMAE
ncbi:hypothetical protein HDU99_001401, partial [Rhizoclosmatium hyalinum]